LGDEVGPPWPKLRVRDLIAALVDGEVDFVVIGGIAAVLHGSPTITHDLDIVFENSAENRERLGAVLTGLGAKPFGIDEEVPFEADARTLDRIQLLTLETSAGRIDVMHPPPGSPSYEDLRTGARLTEIDGIDQEIPVAAIDDLIAMKRAAGRSKDLTAVVELEAIKRLSKESG
jgi:aminoglycoside-2''-adenylyltransferase